VTWQRTFETPGI